MTKPGTNTPNQNPGTNGSEHAPGIGRRSLDGIPLPPGLPVAGPGTETNGAATHGVAGPTAQEAPDAHAAPDLVAYKSHMRYGAAAVRVLAETQGQWVIPESTPIVAGADGTPLGTQTQEILLENRGFVSHAPEEEKQAERGIVLTSDLDTHSHLIFAANLRDVRVVGKPGRERSVKADKRNNALMAANQSALEASTAYKKTLDISGTSFDTAEQAVAAHLSALEAANNSAKKTKGSTSASIIQGFMIGGELKYLVDVVGDGVPMIVRANDDTESFYGETRIHADQDAGLPVGSAKRALGGVNPHGKHSQKQFSYQPRDVATLVENMIDPNDLQPGDMLVNVVGSATKDMSGLPERIEHVLDAITTSLDIDASADNTPSIAELLAHIDSVEQDAVIAIQPHVTDASTEIDDAQEPLVPEHTPAQELMMQKASRVSGIELGTNDDAPSHSVAWARSSDTLEPSDDAIPLGGSIYTSWNETASTGTFGLLQPKGEPHSEAGETNVIATLQQTLHEMSAIAPAISPPRDEYIPQMVTELQEAVVAAVLESAKNAENTIPTVGASAFVGYTKVEDDGSTHVSAASVGDIDVYAIRASGDYELVSIGKYHREGFGVFEQRLQPTGDSETRQRPFIQDEDPASIIDVTLQPGDALIALGVTSDSLDGVPVLMPGMNNKNAIGFVANRTELTAQEKTRELLRLAQGNNADTSNQSVLIIDGVIPADKRPADYTEPERNRPLDSELAQRTIQHRLAELRAIHARALEANAWTRDMMQDAFTLARYIGVNLNEAIPDDTKTVQAAEKRMLIAQVKTLLPMHGSNAAGES